MKEHLLKTLVNSRSYTIAVIEAMPDNFFNFRPVDTVWTFEELGSHIAYGIQWWGDNFVKGNKSDWNPPVTDPGKKAVMGYVNQAYDDLAKTMKKTDLNENVVQGYYATLDHITHHRGQLITYLRCKGITPPDYMY